MKECNRCKNLATDVIPDDEYGDIIFPICISDEKDVSDTENTCEEFAECEKRYFEHELWDDFYKE